MSAQTWVIETAPKGTPDDAPADEIVASGLYWRTQFGGSEKSAREGARQCGAHWRRKGLRVRVRALDEA